MEIQSCLIGSHPKEIVYSPNKYRATEGIIDGFPAAHAISYSICGVQTLNLCYKYPIIYWNTACLIVDSDSFEDTEDNQGSKFDKISTAIADMQKAGIHVALPDINTAQYGFAPDAKNNQIIFSLKAISGAGDDVARAIIQNRPFTSMEDFYKRMIETKIITQAKMIQLIKAGCFERFGERKAIMADYIKRYLFTSASKLTMTHVDKFYNQLAQIYPGLDPRKRNLLLIPDFAKQVIERCPVTEMITTTSTKRKLPQCGYFDRILQLTDKLQSFFHLMYSDESIVGVKGTSYLISEKKFLKETKQMQQTLAEWMNQSELLEKYNAVMFNEAYGKLLSQSVSEWEMNALGYYYAGHELAHVQNDQYGIEDFFQMKEQAEPYDYYARYINGEQKWFPKYTITRIAGTVVGSDNNKHTVTLLTTTGVVNVKFNKGHYVFYNQKISENDPVTGKKKSIEDSWFKRGTKLIICGYRNEFNFRAYKYADTIYTHIVSRIDVVNEDGTLELRVERERR